MSKLCKLVRIEFSSMTFTVQPLAPHHTSEEEIYIYIIYKGKEANYLKKKDSNKKDILIIKLSKIYLWIVMDYSPGHYLMLVKYYGQILVYYNSIRPICR